MSTLIFGMNPMIFLFYTNLVSFARKLLELEGEGEVFLLYFFFKITF